MRFLSTSIAWIRCSPVVALVVVVLIGWGLSAPARGTALLNSTEPGLQGRDVQLYAGVTARVADGEDYYAVLADELPARGYATRPVFNWRLPTLTWMNAMLPSTAWSQGLLILVGFGVVMAWARLLQIEIPRVATAGIPVLVMCMGGMFMKNTAVLHEAWAGLFIAASLACWGLSRPRLSIVLGAAALLIRELSLPFVVLMAAMAWRESRKKEAFAWAGIAVLVGAAWLWHASHVRPLIPADGMSKSWLVMGGWGFALSTAQANPFLLLLPAWLVALIVPVVWAGFWSWQSALGHRLAFVVTGYLGFFMIAGRPENWYWGFLIAPLIGLGALGYFFRPNDLTGASKLESGSGSAGVARGVK